LLAALPVMMRGTVYFHFVEARRRKPIGHDDFTVWLEELSETPDLIEKLHAIDIHLLTLPEIHERLLEAFGSHLMVGGR